MLLKLISKEYLIDNIWAFRFKPEAAFTWMAGQYVRVELPHENPDEEGTKRWFTNSAAPYEGIMQITTRITGTTFKQALSRLEVGDGLTLVEAPEGDFTWQDTDLPVIFVAAGIGVTPFHSILKQRVHDQLSLDLTLIYAGRTNDLPFKDELTEWSSTNPGFNIKYLIGKSLTVDELVKLEPNLNKSLVYLSGPETMVDILGAALIKAGLPEAQFKHDGLANYNEHNY